MSPAGEIQNNSPQTASPGSAPPTPSGAAFEFGEVPPHSPCSANVCPNGHEWAPIFGLGKCPGCASPILVVKMVNCPVCNEPVRALRYRTDHMPHGGQLTPMCLGVASLAEVTVVELERHHAQQEEQGYKQREMVTKV